MLSLIAFLPIVVAGKLRRILAIIFVGIYHFIYSVFLELRRCSLCASFGGTIP